MVFQHNSRVSGNEILLYLQTNTSFYFYTQEFINLPGLHSDSNSSMTVTYLARSGADYGSLLCFARNSIGHMTTPCLSHIIPSGSVGSSLDLCVFFLYPIMMKMAKACHKKHIRFEFKRVHSAFIILLLSQTRTLLQAHRIQWKIVSNLESQIHSKSRLSAVRVMTVVSNRLSQRNYTRTRITLLYSPLSPTGNPASPFTTFRREQGLSFVY